MNKSALPRIRLAAKPAGLTFKPPKSAVARWDNTLHAAKQQDAQCAIDIMGEIGDSGFGADCTTAATVKAQLSAAGKAPVYLTINSPGGDAFEGIAIYNLLRDYPGAVTVNVLGLAASAASIIAMAADKILIGEAAFLMIHSGWGVVMGNRNDMRQFADVLDQLDTSVAGLYARRSGMPAADILAMMEKETWMNGAEAVRLGFADVAVADDKKKAKAAVEHASFMSTPAAVIAASASSQRPVVRLSAQSPANSTTAARKKGVVYL
jgi:ATP-dependent Clp protease protease subunit